MLYNFTVTLSATFCAVAVQCPGGRYTVLRRQPDVLTSNKTYRPKQSDKSGIVSDCSLRRRGHRIIGAQRSPLSPIYGF